MYLVIYSVYASLNKMGLGRRSESGATNFNFTRVPSYVILHSKKDKGIKQSSYPDTAQQLVKGL